MRYNGKRSVLSIHGGKQHRASELCARQGIKAAAAIAVVGILGVLSDSAKAVVTGFVNAPTGGTRSDTLPQEGFGFYSTTLGTSQINELGYWVSPQDSNGSGVTAVAHTVGLYHYNGTNYSEVEQATVPAGSVPDASGYAWVSIPTYALTDTSQGADYYILTASCGTDLWTNGGVSVNAANPTPFGSLTNNGWFSEQAAFPGVGNTIGTSGAAGPTALNRSGTRFGGPNIGFQAASQPGFLSWSGAATGANTSLWDTTAVDNFTDQNGVPTQFNNGNTVSFADLVPGTQATVTNGNVIIQNGGVAPALVTFFNANVVYTVSDSDGTNGITGSTGINKSGGGLVTFNAANGFTGPVNVMNGTLALGSSQALGSSSGINVSGGTLYVQPGITIPSSIPVALGTNSTTINALTFNQSTATSTLNYSNPIALTADAAIGTVQGDLTLSGIISGAGGLAINTPGQLFLTNANAYQGDTTITSGNVILSGSINAANAANPGNLHLATGTNNIGRLAINGGTANFTGSDSNIALGRFATAALEVDSGSLNVTQSIQIGPNVGSYGELLANGGAITIGVSLQLAAPYGTGVATLNPGGSLTTSGSFGVNLGGNSTTTGILNLDGGTLTTATIQSMPNSGGHLNFNGGVLKASGASAQFIASIKSAYIYSGGAIIDDGGNALTIPASLSTPDGSGITSIPVTAPGSGYSYQPVIQIVGGTLTPNGTAATAVATYSAGQVTGFVITNPGNYSSTAGLSISLAGGNGTPPSIGAIATAPNVGGGFTKRGTGTITLSGSNTYTGPTLVTAGKLQVSAPGASVSIQNPSFENNPINGYTYYNGAPNSPAGDGWNYFSDGGPTEGAGVTSGGGFGFNGAPPDGTQAAFLQKVGAIQQAVNFPATGTYTLSFYTEQRGGNQNVTPQVLDADLDNPSSGGTDLTPGGFTPTGDWSLMTVLFSTTAGTHNITFQGVSTADNTAYIDDVTLTSAALAGAASAIPTTSPVVLSNAATFDVNGFTQTIGSLTGPAGSFVTLGIGGALTVGGDGSNTTFSGSISGAGGLTKINGGTQTLAGSNSYSGGTNVSGGILAFAAPVALPLFTSLTIGSGAEAIAAPHIAAAPKNTLFVTGLSIAGAAGAWTGILDLANNDMVVRAGSLATINNQVAQGYAGGTWQGSGGILSSAAAADSRHLTALGVIQNNVDGTAGGSALYPTFDGQSVSNADVLVKYTYYGDTNLNGNVDGTDYSRIDNASNYNTAHATNPLTGWFNGDFNYDGVINGSDYTLIDNAFNSQGVQISAAVAAFSAGATAQIAGSGATSAVPEPASMGVLSVAAMSLLSRRRSRTRKDK